MATPIINPPELSKQRIDYVWSKIDKTPGYGPKGTCWIWTGYCDKFGYGKLGFRDCRIPVHKLIYWLTTHDWPYPLCVLHGCDNPPCCNPDHLHKGTKAENCREMHERGRTASGDQHGMRLHPEKIVRGTQHHFTKITEADVEAIRRDCKSPSDCIPFAEHLGLTKGHVWDIAKRRKSWKHLP